MQREPAEQTSKRHRFEKGNTVGRQWEKGQSGNPKGSPKKPASITMHLREELAKLGKSGKTKAQEIAEGMVKAAISPVAATGSAKVLGEVLDRTEGKVTQPIGGDPDQPIIIKVEYEKERPSEVK